MKNWVGKKIRIQNMAGEPSYSGREGIIQHIDDIGQLHGSWGGLAVVVWKDDFVFIEEK